MIKNNSTVKIIGTHWAESIGIFIKQTNDRSLNCIVNIKGIAILFNENELLVIDQKLKSFL